MNLDDDKAGRDYWDRAWLTSQLPPALNPDDTSWRNFVWRRFHRYFVTLFANRQTRGQKLLEVGCAASVFLPYFSKCFGFEVLGLDYSPIGCEKAHAALDREGVGGKVYCADFASPPRGLLEEADVVFSFGVVEHFRDTTAAIGAISRLLKPGGTLITFVPNLAGLMGRLQKVLGREQYDVHVVLDRASLASYHARAGLQVERCDYFLFLYLGVLNLDSWRKSSPGQTAFRFGRWFSRSLGIAVNYLPFLKPNRWTSPFIACVATKRAVNQEPEFSN